jgi:hypothetical protein
MSGSGNTHPFWGGLAVIGFVVIMGVLAIIEAIWPLLLIILISWLLWFPKS